jgi:hypothetical protein
VLFVCAHSNLNWNGDEEPKPSTRECMARPKDIPPAFEHLHSKSFIARISLRCSKCKESRGKLLLMNANFGPEKSKQAELS